MSNSFADLVNHARSCRRFNNADPVPRQVVVDLIDLARICPSAANQQPLRYRVVADPAECQTVFPHTKWAGALKTWSGPADAERPTAYVVILSATGTNPGIDVGIAAQTIQLGATEHGYAACMLGAIDRTGIHTDLALPAELQIQLLIALGRPGETIVLEPLPPDGNLTYWRTPDQVHHVPKRSLEQVLVR